MSRYISRHLLRIAIFTIITISLSCTNKTYIIFNETNAYNSVKYQLSLGARTIGSPAHQEFIKWASGELVNAGWGVELQTFEWSGNMLTNIIATRGTGIPLIILGAHYDSRFFADQDPNPDMRGNPVPGANDGASGVAILIEIAKVLPSDLEKEVWIVLFDAEDNGNIPGWEWIIGSRVFVANLTEKPDAVVIIDMVGDEELSLYMEKYSSPQLVEQIWELADELGYSQFIPEYRHQILDDHVPFLEAGIPAVDIIDFDYPYWHTTQDTVDKVSPESLDAVGELLLEWLLQ